MVASVTIGEETKDSGIDGVVQFTRAYGDYEATISAEGYTTVTEELAFRSNHKNFTVELEAETPVVTTGTVTVTCQDSSQQTTSYPSAILYTGDVPPSEQDDSMVVAGGSSDGDPFVMVVYDTSTHQGTENTAIPFGTYTLFADAERGQISYTGTLVVDGDEEVTITLTSGGGSNYNFSQYSQQDESSFNYSGTMTPTGQTDTYDGDTIYEYEIVTCTDPAIIGGTVWFKTPTTDGTTYNEGYYEDSGDYQFDGYYTLAPSQ